MKIKKVKITYRNKRGELNKICGLLELPNKLTFTPESGEKFSPRRIASDNIADIDILDADSKLMKFKKQYKKD